MMKLDIEREGLLFEEGAIADGLLGLAGELLAEGSVVGLSVVGVVIGRVCEFMLLCRCCYCVSDVKGS